MNADLSVAQSTIVVSSFSRQKRRIWDDKRTYDWFEQYVEFAQNLTVTVFNPDSCIPDAIVTFAGVIYATTGMNAEGISAC
jgi:hypothetical protein